MYIKRPALVVDNLERSLEIYQGILGFKVQFIKASAADSYSYDVFNIPKHIPMRFATLTGDGPDVSIFGLIEAPGARTPPLPNEVRASAVVIHVDDLDGAIAALHRRCDVTVLPEFALTTQDGRKGREVAIIDPDGHAVLLYQIATKDQI
jgi:catechol 2,3-dioxygenase-like lactoylglutathione lyase family enzyme